MPPKKIYLVRHGETEWALSGRHTGRTDIPLTENGKKKAALLGAALHSIPLTLILVSPLIRAKETFEIAHLPLEGTLCDDLKEWDYGDYEGLTSKEIHQKNPNWNVFKDGAPGGESIADMTKRADRVLERALQASGDVALFSSAHILRCIAARWLKMPLDFGKHLVLNTGSISILGHEHANPALLLWNNIVA
ncbi:MAG: histidine phosphatase family protein [Chlamydiota bacterium]